MEDASLLRGHSPPDGQSTDCRTFGSTIGGVIVGKDVVGSKIVVVNNGETKESLQNGMLATDILADFEI